MDCKIDIIPRVLHFKQPAGTSRGTYTTRKVWYLHFTAPEFPNWVGIGECAPLPNLSCDDLPDYEEVLAKICRQVENQGGKLDMEALCKYPSILFGLETAIRHFFEGSWALWDTPFSRGEAGIPINGLIWMGDFNRMLAQIEKKMEAGFKPSLHGGLAGGEEWIAEAEKLNIGWWITSALESNIGLNAIAQWCATFQNPLPQGLGTGLLFTDNVEMPLEIRKDCLWFCK